MQACSLQLEVQDLVVDEGSGNQGGNINGRGFYSANPTGHFGHLIAKFFDVFPGFIHEPHFLKGLDKRANDRRVDLLLILDNGSKDLSPRVVVPKLFSMVSQSLGVMDASTDFTLQVIISQSKFQTGRQFSTSGPNPCSRKGLGPLRKFPFFGRNPVI